MIFFLNWVETRWGAWGWHWVDAGRRLRGEDFKRLLNNQRRGCFGYLASTKGNFWDQVSISSRSQYRIQLRWVLAAQLLVDAPSDLIGSHRRRFPRWILEAVVCAENSCWERAICEVRKIVQVLIKYIDNFLFSFYKIAIKIFLRERPVITWGFC